MIPHVWPQYGFRVKYLHLPNPEQITKQNASAPEKILYYGEHKNHKAAVCKILVPAVGYQKCFAISNSLAECTNPASVKYHAVNLIKNMWNKKI